MAGRSIAKQLTNLGIAVPGPSARLKPIRKLQFSFAPRAAVEAAVPAAVDDAGQKETPVRKNAAPIEDATARNRSQPRRSDQRNKEKRAEGGNDGRDSSSRQSEAFDRAIINERSRLLLNGEAVGLTMKSTPADLATGFKGLRPLAKELRRQNQTLLFFPSTRAVKPEQSEERSAESGDLPEQQPQEKPATSRELDLALVAVPYFQKPEAEVTIRVGARSKPDVIARTLTRALLRSSSVAVRAAGPAAALVALQAAAKARRAIGAEQQLDLAFSIEYLRVPATEASKPPGEDGDVVAVAVAAAESAAAAAAAAAGAADISADAAQGAGGDGATSSTADATMTASSVPERAAPMTSVLQFSFYKRALPTPEVKASDFAATRSGPAMAQLLTSLISERREVDLLLESRDALFVMQTLARVVRDSWIESKASVGVFLTSLEYQTEEYSDAESNGDTSSEGNNVRFTARLQLRRILGAPNLVPVNERRTLLGVPVGTVKWDSPIGALGGAMVREWYSAGIFSVWPQEGICVARMLRALWKAQQTRAATAAAAGSGEAAAVGSDPTNSTDSDDAAAAAGAPSSSILQIALVPELQEEGSGSVEARDGREDRRRTTQREGRVSSRQQVARSTVVHLLEVSPALTSTLRSKGGRVVLISGGEQLHQLIKAVVLRNRMYGSRQGGKLLTLRPLLDDSGALAVRFQYIDNSVITEIPTPPGAGRELTQPVVRSRRPAAPPPPPIEDGYATDDEFGVGAEAAVLVPAAAAGAAAAAAVAARAAGSTSAGAKSPWIMFATSNTSSMKLAMGIVAETCKPYDRLCPIWLRVRVLPDTLATAALSVAMAQAQVQERANVELLVLPVLERKRDEQNRPYNALTWQLIKYGPGAEPGAAAAAAAAAAQPRFGPSAAAMAAAAAAAAKVQAQGDALISGTRKLW